MTIDTDAVAQEARKHFSLADRLKNRTARTAEVTVFTDDELGERHARAELEVARLEKAKELAGDEWTGAKLLTAARRDHKSLTEELKRKRVTLNLRAVPAVVLNDGRGAAKRHLDIKGEVPAEREQEVADVVNAFLLSRATVTWYDHEYDETNPTLSLDDAVALRGYLPAQEKMKLDIKLGELQYANTISATVTNDPDF